MLSVENRVSTVASLDHSGRHIGVCVPDAEAVDDDIEESDDKDDDEDDVVEDAGAALLLLVIDVQAAQHEEHDADEQLKKYVSCNFEKKPNFS